MEVRVSTTPRGEGFVQPGEWAPHEAVWSAWPSDGELWQEHLAAAQAEFVGLCEAIAAGPGAERLEILVADAAAARAAAPAASGRAEAAEVAAEEAAAAAAAAAAASASN